MCVRARARATKATPYWKVKNSWGTKFGVAGYFYLARGVYKGELLAVVVDGSY